MTTAFFTEPRFQLHTQAGHPEHAGRLTAVVDLLEQYQLLDDLHQIEAQPATDEQILAVHKQNYLDFLASTALLDGGTFLGMDTYIMPESYELARLAAGGVCAIVDAILHGEANNGIAAVRPPGHHATPSQGMGFCLFSNIAIAAKHARQRFGLQRIAIVDFDVHHGNGTQDALYDDDILFISSHQSPLYPGTGRINETGKRTGQGYTVNIPLPAGTGDDAFEALYTGFVSDVLRRDQPQLLLISAGFDAHFVDPLANLHLSLSGFHQISRHLMTLADELCGGKIAFVMEGGYDLTALSHGWLNIAYGLLGQDHFQDPIGHAPRQKPLDTQLVEQLREIHDLFGAETP